MYPVTFTHINRPLVHFVKKKWSMKLRQQRVAVHKANKQMKKINPGAFTK